jgi:uncharacterized protein YecT (DUF1311 family)
MKRRPVVTVAALVATVAAVALILAGGGASAAPSRDTYSSCLKHAQSTFDMDQCVTNERRRLRPLLAAAYNKLLNDPAADAHHRHLLVLSERAWTTYEKRDCNLAGDSARGGTLAPVIAGECLINRTRTRIKDLKAFAVPLGQ